MMHPAYRPVLLTAMLAASHAAHAADEGIVTDRPDFVESSKVVGKGRFQVETSVLFERDRHGAGRERTVATPTLLRQGISENFELRVETDGRTSISSRAAANGYRSTASGYADATLGVKWHAMDAAGNMPSVGVLLHAEFSSGSRALRGRGTRPSLRAVGEWELANDFSLGVMPGVGIERSEDGRRYRYGILGVVVGKAVNDKLRGFVELALPQIASAKHGGTQASLDFGGAYLITDTIQVDAMVSRGLNSRTPDVGFTVGLSFKR